MTIQKEPKELFSRILQPAQEILDEIGPDRKVYPVDKILRAFEISRLDFDICNYRTYSESIPDAQSHIDDLTSKLEVLLKSIEEQDGYEIDPEFGFDATDYLDAMCLRVSTYIKEQGAKALCFLRKDRLHIEPYFAHYHAYKFLERHLEYIGAEEFLRRIPDLECFIIDANINDEFYWHKFDTAPLYEAEDEQRDRAELAYEMKIGRD